MTARFLIVLTVLSATLVSASLAQSFQLPLRVEVNGGTYDILHFGVNPSATFCADPGLGEIMLPPSPPSMIFDVRFIDPRSGDPACFDQGMKLDLRPYTSATQIDTYKVHFQPGASGFPVRFSWLNLNPYYTNPVWLRDPINGTFVNVNMKSDTTYLLDIQFTSLLIITGDGPSILPPSTNTYQANSVSQTSARLAGGLNPNGNATTGWFEWGTTTSYGNSTPPQSVGNGTQTISLSTVISGLSPQTAYHYRSVGQNVSGTTYGTDQSFTTIASGTIGQTLIPINVTDTGGGQTTVWVGVHPLATYCIDPMLGEALLPPTPGHGVFDVRLVDPRGFNSGCFDQGVLVDLRQHIGPSQVDTSRMEFQPGGSYPFTFTWPNLASYFNDPVRLVDPYGGFNVNIDMKAQTSFTLTNPVITSLLVTSGSATTAVGEEPTVPEAFALYQNYPNPFNPETRIEFDLPTTSHVTLTLFDLLGREIRALTDEEISPGHKSIIVDASSLASGTYYYRLSAGKFTAIRKMVVMK